MDKETFTTEFQERNREIIDDKKGEYNAYGR